MCEIAIKNSVSCVVSSSNGLSSTSITNIMMFTKIKKKKKKKPLPTQLMREKFDAIKINNK